MFLAPSTNGSSNYHYKYRMVLHTNTKCNLAVPKMKTAYGQKSFAFRGADTWNKLDSEMKLAPSIQSFKTKLKL